MICVILPLGKEAKQVTDWVVRVIMYTAGSVVGAAMPALLLGLFGKGLHAVAPFVGPELAVGLLGVAAFAFALHELNIIRLPNPQLRWLVPKAWMRHSRLFAHTAYGIVLGAGVFTFIPFAGFYLLLALEVVAGAADLRVAVGLGMIYGLLRGAPAVIGGISVLRGQYPIPVTNWLIGHLGWWHAINALALLLFAGFLLGSFVV